jgi:hypothetical protein
MPAPNRYINIVPGRPPIIPAINPRMKIEYCIASPLIFLLEPIDLIILRDRAIASSSFAILLEHNVTLFILWSIDQKCQLGLYFYKSRRSRLPRFVPGWIVYNYFPASSQRDFCHFLPVGELISSMRKTGFLHVHVKREHQKEERNLREFLNYAPQRHHTSQLMGIQAHISPEGCLVWKTGEKAE